VLFKNTLKLEKKRSKQTLFNTLNFLTKRHWGRVKVPFPTRHKHVMGKYEKKQRTQELNVTNLN